MSGTKQQASIKELRKLIKHFPNYSIIGNKPYAKGVLLIAKGKNGGVIQTFKKNYDAFKAMITPGWAPDKPILKVKGLFEVECKIHQSMTRLIHKKCLDYGMEFHELAEAIGINPFDRDCINNINKRLQRL